MIVSCTTAKWCPSTARATGSRTVSRPSSERTKWPNNWGRSPVRTWGQNPVRGQTRYLRLVPLPEGHSAGQLRDALIAALSELPERARRSLTWDQGSEMARHHELAPYFTDGIFFARPGSPWERGTNENTNGLIRQYLPKRTNLSLHTADDLRVIEHRLNNRPRKTLSWQTPSQAFATALAL
ncbi:IS30 family transposase [Streptomyces sp. NPDC046805]|uniref:IS30 family transposase n=1 Tax=Streptomyces sp. NPDC046805 TaxID=3155134 RepID=UPI003410FB9E